jgi:hypothetical protein
MGHIAVLLRRAQRKIKRTQMNFTRTIRLLAILISFCSLLAAQVPPLAIADQALPLLDAGVDFHILLHANGGVPPYVWSVASGDLPKESPSPGKASWPDAPPSPGLSRSL